MNKEELVEKMNEIIIELKERTNIDAWQGGYLCAFAECLEWVNELDEPRVEECEILGGFTSEAIPYSYCSYCECSFAEEDSLPENSNKVNYCPNCGRKIKCGLTRIPILNELTNCRCGGKTIWY